MKPRVAEAGGIRYVEYRFPTARDARRFIQESALEDRYDVSARIQVNPPLERRDWYKKARGAVYVPIWSVEGDERKPNAAALRVQTRLLRKESEIVARMTDTDAVVLRVAERSDPVWRLVADGVVRRKRKPPKKYAKLEEFMS